MKREASLSRGMGSSLSFCLGGAAAEDEVTAAAAAAAPPLCGHLCISGCSQADNSSAYLLCVSPFCLRTRGLCVRICPHMCVGICVPGIDLDHETLLWNRYSVSLSYSPCRHRSSTVMLQWRAEADESFTCPQSQLTRVQRTLHTQERTLSDRVRGAGICDPQGCRIPLSRLK